MFRQRLAPAIKLQCNIISRLRRQTRKRRPKAALSFDDCGRLYESLMQAIAQAFTEDCHRCASLIDMIQRRSVPDPLRATDEVAWLLVRNAFSEALDSGDSSVLALSDGRISPSSFLTLSAFATAKRFRSSIRYVGGLVCHDVDLWAGNADDDGARLSY